ncbi:MAG: hypothetical protein PHH92_10740 [Aliarcobacter skirrowii]|uniref:hypothetical protein n=1 Tax=Aliarcobacter skirrowii TaxID=28200 RepID=UPI00242B3CD8|nr:hypothetical protein [Aliarcobacter skirrowii]MDD3497848.1 hypothetical protein [Aliarcobacter skirrowii]
MKEAIKKLLDISDVSYYRWKKERPIFDLLETYFTKDELNEFLETGKIEKFEAIKNRTKEEIENKFQLDDSKTLVLLEDLAFFSLKDKLSNKLFPIWDFTGIFPKRVFLKVLREVSSDTSFSLETAKLILEDKLKNYQTKLLDLEHPNHILKLQKFVNENISKIEAFILAKEPERFL